MDTSANGLARSVLPAQSSLVCTQPPPGPEVLEALGGCEAEEVFPLGLRVQAHHPHAGLAAVVSSLLPAEERSALLLPAEEEGPALKVVITPARTGNGLNAEATKVEVGGLRTRA